MIGCDAPLSSRNLATRESEYLVPSCGGGPEEPATAYTEVRVAHAVRAA